MPAQSLSLTLKRVARAGSVELAFDRAATDRLNAPPLKGQFTIDQALAAALAGTGLNVQRTQDGAYVIKLGLILPNPRPTTSDDGAVSELLVLGRRSLNTGIRRTRDDIQPYDVALDGAIRDAGAGDVEAFLRAAMPADAQASSFSQAPALNSGSARSRIDLLGLGGDQTLVLIDGRRLPSTPEAVGNGAGFVQADLNGVPLAAIERVEVLTAAAGALYGPGATGGAVNIVLKRDYQGAEVTATQGATEHGGGLTHRVDAMIGRTSSDGRGGVSVRIGLSKDRGLAVGERMFGSRALTVDGADFLAGQTAQAYNVPLGAGVNVVSLNGPLTLKPAYGGGALGSATTHVSTAGFSAAEALANAGTLDLELSPDAYGEKQSLLTGTLRRSLVVSARQEVGVFEGFVDYFAFDNQGSATLPAGTILFSLGANSPYNPFEQSVWVSRSVPWQGVVRNRSFTQRANGGVIVRLPAEWTAEADLSWSQSRVRVANPARGNSLYADLAVTSGSDSYGPNLSPFAAQDAYMAAYEAYQLAGGSLLKLSDTLGDINLRASGPLWRLPGGPMTMTLAAEAWSEKAPGGASFTFDSLGAPKTTPGNRLRLATRSAYAEWRAPLTSTEAPAPLRGLELQLALRTDAYRMTSPQFNESVGQATYLTDMVSKHAVAASTLGLKTFLADGVMLRTSYSEGHRPPQSDDVQSRVITWRQPFALVGDAKRGGQIIGTDGTFVLIGGGSPRLQPEAARTYSLGLVFTPRWPAGARLSVDYLRTEKRREIVDLAQGSATYILNREALYPDRVVRAPLTDADRAKGYTVGAITLLDISPLNVGRSVAETLDVSADYRRDLGAGVASARLRAVWQPSYRRRGDPQGAWIETAGYSDGPLRFRAFATAQWSGDSIDLGLNAQFYGRYKVAESGYGGQADALAVERQGSDHIRPQIYLDAFSRWSFGEGRRTQAQLFVRNLLDGRPPLALASAMGYSTYGDARGRGVELSLTRRF